jgi:microcystin-dependent protein
VIGTGSITAGSGPTQAANRIIKLVGTLSANCQITFPCPGSWIVKNSCSGSFTVTARAIGTGNIIGLPPGEAVEVWNDGTDFDFMNLDRVGIYMDLAVSTTPGWMSACTVLPYLPCIGTATYSASVFPTLAAMLGSTFGGNGINNFAVPDLGNRVRVPLGTRLTTSVCGIDGNTLGAAGGTAVAPLQPHVHGASVTDNGHRHFEFNTAGGGSIPTTANQQPTVSGNPGGDGSYTINGSAADATIGQSSLATTNISVSIATAGASSPDGNLQPTLVAGITFIRAG